MKRIGFSIEKDENKNTEIPTVPQITDEPVRSVVTVRFPGGREYLKKSDFSLSRSKSINKPQKNLML